MYPILSVLIYRWWLVGVLLILLLSSQQLQKQNQNKNQNYYYNQVSALEYKHNNQQQPYQQYNNNKQKRKQRFQTILDQLLNRHKKRKKKRQKQQKQNQNPQNQNQQNQNNQNVTKNDYEIYKIKLLSHPKFIHGNLLLSTDDDTLLNDAAFSSSTTAIDEVDDEQQIQIQKQLQQLYIIRLQDNLSNTVNDIIYQLLRTNPAIVLQTYTNVFNGFVITNILIQRLIDLLDSSSIIMYAAPVRLKMIQIFY
jgi:hypothetical protein